MHHLTNVVPNVPSTQQVENIKIGTSNSTARIAQICLFPLITVQDMDPILVVPIFYYVPPQAGQWLVCSISSSHHSISVQSCSWTGPNQSQYKLSQKKDRNPSIFSPEGFKTQDLAPAAAFFAFLFGFPCTKQEMGGFALCSGRGSTEPRLWALKAAIEELDSDSSAFNWPSTSRQISCWHRYNSQHLQGKDHGNSCKWLQIGKV